MVKCAKCGHKWREYPPEDLPKQVVQEVTPEPVQEPEKAPEPEAPAPEDQGMSIEQMTQMRQQRAQQVETKSRRKKSIFGWLLFILILAGIGVGGYHGRNYVVQFWPASAKLYQMLKLDVKTTNLLGLEIHDLKTKSILENGIVRLTVTGRIKNITGEEQPIPRIGIQLVDSNGHHVYSWSTSIEETHVTPWGEIEFSSSMNQPPEEAKHVKAHLIAPKDLMKKPEQDGESHQ